MNQVLGDHDRSCEKWFDRLTIEPFDNPAFDKLRPTTFDRLWPRACRGELVEGLLPEAEPQ